MRCYREYTFIASTFEPGDADLEPEASGPVLVNVDQDIDGVVLTMGRGARVSGHVTLAVEQGKLPPTLRVVVAAPALGRGFARAYVLLFSADPKRRGTWAHGFRDTRADTEGRFSIKPLRAAKYLIVALEPGGVGPLDAEMFAKLASIATPVEVLENENGEVSLTVSKIPQ